MNGAANHRPDHLQSSLWDRLSKGTSEPASAPCVNSLTPSAMRDAMGVTRRDSIGRLQQVRRELERDVLQLLTTRQVIDETELQGRPHIRRSVLHYGLPSFTGLTSSGVALQGAANEIAKQIETFEPRFHRGSVQVACRLGSTPGELVIDVEALFGPEDQLQVFSLSSSLRFTSGEAAEYGRLGR